MRGSDHRPVSGNSWLIALVPLLIALVPPAAYFALDYRALGATLRTEAEFKAGVVSDIIARTSDMWKFQQHRLEELVARRASLGSERSVHILDEAGHEIASVGPTIAFPSVVYSENLFDAGIRVGRVEIVSSLRRLLLETAAVAFFSALLGASLFWTLRRLARREECVTEALFTEKERAEITLHSISDGVVTTGAADTVEYLNSAAEALTGWPQVEAYGRPVGEVLCYMDESAHEASAGVRTLADSVEGVKTSSEQAMLLRRDGSCIPVECSAATIRGRNAEAVGRVIAIRDVSERRAAEEAIRLLNSGLEERVRERTAELGRVNQDLESFAYSVSHDLRAPLRAVAGFAQMVNEDYREALPPQARNYLDRIAAGASTMGRLVDGLLEFARLGRVKLNEKIVRPADLARDVLADNAEEILRRGVETRIGELPECVADAVLLRQVYANLLGNALKYTARREHAEIEVGSIHMEGKTVYFVRDNGAGFDQQYADKLFGMFQRLHSPAEFGGEGIGLATVRRIVERHGGRVWAESALEKGATFYFTI